MNTRREAEVEVQGVLMSLLLKEGAAFWSLGRVSQRALGFRVQVEKMDFSMSLVESSQVG